jgi:glutaredoxin
MSVEVVLYSAAGCHLCEDARRTLIAARGRLGFDLVEVDIAADPELEARYRSLIPVIRVAGRRSFTYRVDPLELERAVQAAADGR